MVDIVEKTVVYQGSLRIYKVTFSNNDVRYFVAKYFDTTYNYIVNYGVKCYISPNKDFSPIIFETTQHKALLMPIRYIGN